MSERFERQAVEGNSPDAIAELRRQQELLKTQLAKGGRLSDITDDLGEVTRGRFRVVDDNGNTRMILSGENLLEELGVSAHFVGLDADGVPQFWMDADNGAGTFAGGDGVIDDEGIHTNGVRYGILQHAQDPAGSYPREACLEMFYPGSTTYPAWRLRLANVLNTTNLLTNGDFETGDTTGWEVTDDLVAGSITATSDGAGGYYGLYESTGGSPRLRTVPATITEKLGYYIEVYASANCPATAPSLSLFVDFYSDAGGTVYAGGQLVDFRAFETLESGGYGFETTKMYGYVHAAKNAVTAKLRFYVNYSGGPYSVIVDNAKLIQRDFSELILNLDAGQRSSHLNFRGPTSAEITAGPDYDTAAATSHSSLIGEVLVNKPMRITGALWDVRNTGDYTLYLANAGDGLAIRELWSGTVGSAGEITMTFTEPLVLTTGVHFLRLYRSGGATTWWTVAAAYGAIGDDFRVNRISRDMGASWATGSIPAKLVYTPGEWS
jgi:hypothetical protein